MGLYSIKDLEKLSGIKAHTIRVWERRYRIVKPGRTDTNRRRYDDDDLRRIINISILRKNGFKISDIATFSSSEIEHKVSFLSKEVLHSDTQVDSLVAAMVDQNEKAVNDLLIRLMMNKGIEEAMDTVILPFLRRVGIMWQTGSADVGSEHFITNLFRQKLISSIDALSYELKPVRKKIILFLPENELHEIGLLYFHYIIKKRGHESIYLGQSTPLFSVAGINRNFMADILVTGLLSDSPDIGRETYLNLLSSTFPGQKILVAGWLAEAALKISLPNIFPVTSADDLKSFL